MKLKLGVVFFFSAILTFAQDLEPIYSGINIPQTHFFVSGGARGQILIWDDKRGEESRRLSVGGGKILSLTYLGGKKFAAGNSFGEIFLCNYDSDKIERQWQGHENFIRTLQGSPDGKVLFSAGDDKILKAWNVETGAPVFQIKTLQEKAIRCLAISASYDWLACGSEDGTIVLVDPQTGSNQKSWKAHNGSIQALSTIPGKPNSLISAGSDKFISVWNSSNGSRIVNSSTGNLSIVSLAVDSKGTKIACGSFLGDLEYRDISTLDVFWRVSDHMAAVNQVLILPQDRGLVSLSEDQTIKLWNLATGQNWGVIGRTFNEASPDTMIEPEIFHAVSSLIPLTENRWAVSRNWSPVIIIDPENKILAKGPEALLLCSYPSKKKLFLSLSGGIVGLYDENLITTTWQKKVYEKNVTAMTLSVDGLTLYAGTEDGTLLLIESSTGKEIKRIRGHTDQIRKLVIRPGTLELASGSDDKRVIRWDLKNLSILAAYENHVDYVRALAYSPNGEFLVSGGDDLMIYLYNFKNSKISTFSNQSGTAYDANFSPDGKNIGVVDGQSLVWIDINSGTRIKETPWPGQKIVFFAWDTTGRAALGTETGQIRYGQGNRPWEFKEFIGQ